GGRYPPVLTVGRVSIYAGREFFTAEELGNRQDQIHTSAARHPRNEGYRTGRGGRVQRRLHHTEAYRPAHVAHRRAARWTSSGGHSARAETASRNPRVSTRPSGDDRHLQEQVAWLRGREVHGDHVAKAIRATSLLHDRAHEPQRRSRGSRFVRAM